LASLTALWLIDWKLHSGSGAFSLFRVIAARYNAPLEKYA
jgi:hypothetical protein